MKDLKEKTLKGGAAKLCNQALNFPLRLVSMAFLARMLTPADFGLVAMVTVVTGIFDLFTTAGLSSATVQRATITDEQVSSLFWINIMVGTVLALLCAATAPLLAAFYHEPRLLPIAVALAAGFLFNAAGVQHSALLQRQMRFLALSVIETLALAMSIGVGIVAAAEGCRYWALVAMAIASPAISTCLKWFTTGWTPGRPALAAGMREMISFGSTLTLNSLVVYLAYNVEKVLLGRLGGPDVLGLYSRAYYLTTIPTDNLNSAVGSVGFAALSRLQGQPVLLKSYFLKGYSLLMSVTLPMTMFFALSADELILVLLGPKWAEAAVIFRLLTPTVLVFGMLNPWGWLLPAIGLQQRSLQVALVMAPTVVTAYLLGLPYGARGVAMAYSGALVLLVVPLIGWCIHGTVFSWRDVLSAIKSPFISALAAATVTLAFQLSFRHSLSHLLVLVAGGAVMLVSYSWIILFVMGQKEMYLNLLRELKGGTAGKVAAGAD